MEIIKPLGAAQQQLLHTTQSKTTGPTDNQSLTFDLGEPENEKAPVQCFMNIMMKFKGQRYIGIF